MRLCNRCKDACTHSNAAFCEEQPFVIIFVNLLIVILNLRFGII